MGFGLILAGFILLFNPVITIVDIIPDTIGFFLIVAGLSKMSCFIGKFSLAKDDFLKLAFVQIAKIICIAFIPFTSGSALVLMAFVFGIIELLLFIPAVINLFEGLSFAGLWYNGNAVYAQKQVSRKVLRLKSADGKENKGKKKLGFETVTRTKECITKTRNYILFFYIFRVCATFIPEITELEMYDHLGEVNAFNRSMASFKPLLYLIFSFAVIVLGIVYIVKISRYFGSIRRDTAFIEGLTNKYAEERKNRPTFFIASNMKLVLFIYCIAVVSSFIMPFDGVNVMIGAISSLTLIATSVMLSKYHKIAIASAAVAGVRAVISVFSCVLQVDYFVENLYTVEAISWVTKAYDMYYRMALIGVIENAVALVSVLIYLAVLLKVIKIHLSMFGVNTDSVQYNKRTRDLEVYNIVGGRLLMCGILAVINYIMGGAFHYINVNTEIAVLLSSSATVIWTAYTFSTVNTINKFVYGHELQIS
ncbi:MAG: hypothetical protein E7672_04185 [Ruminococcaceae bacterium]|nr:hypothetical protein [Oscillospiraceae bacterium]